MLVFFAKTKGLNLVCLWGTVSSWVHSGDWPVPVVCQEVNIKSDVTFDSGWAVTVSFITKDYKRRDAELDGEGKLSNFNCERCS